MSHISVLRHETDLAEVYPHRLDFSPLEADLDRILQGMSQRERKRNYEQLSRVEVLARLAWGAYPLLRALAAAVVEEQTIAGYSVSETAKQLCRFFPFKPADLPEGGSALVMTRADIRSHLPKGGEDTSGSSGPPRKDEPPPGRD
jgi:hypothetical protein